MEEIYIVLSQTGTRFSRMLHLFNRFPYNHASIALDGTLSELYSFGRQCLWLPIASGFVREHPGRGIYRRYGDTLCAVYRVPVAEESFRRLEAAIRAFEEKEWTYRYNFIGLLTILAGIPLHRSRHFVCSQFVAYVLQQSGLWALEKDISLARPQDFSKLPGARLVYQGRLNDYCRPVRLLPVPAVPQHLSA
jgi:hypothetical protein